MYIDNFSLRLKIYGFHMKNLIAAVNYCLTIYIKSTCKAVKWMAKIMERCFFIVVICEQGLLEVLVKIIFHSGLEPRRNCNESKMDYEEH